jgi:hypothetical protein
MHFCSSRVQKNQSKRARRHHLISQAGSTVYGTAITPAPHVDLQVDIFSVSTEFNSLSVRLLWTS